MINSKTILTVILISLLSTGCIDETPEDQIKSAKDYIQKQDNKSALIHLKSALQKNPESGEARFLLGTVFLQEGNIPAAEIEFRKALAAKHPNSVVVPELARVMLLSNQAKKLIDQFGSTRLNQPAADANLQTTLASAHASLGKTEPAKSALNAALAADPDYVPALILSARQKAAERDFEGALTALEDILGKTPDNAEAWKLKGDVLLYALDKIDDALITYRKSIEVKTKFVEGHFAVLAILMRQNKLDEASKQLAELKKIALKNPETKYMEAQLAYQKKDYKLARELGQELLRLASNNPRILQLVGAVEFQTNSLAQAEIYLVRATQTAPQSALSQRLLISTYLRSGQPAKALSALNALKGKEGLDPRFYSLAGEVYLQNGDAKTAEDYFSKALKSDPDNIATRTALAVTHLATGQRNSALDELEDIAESNAGTKADMALISAHLRRNDFDKALAAVAKLEAKQPDKPVAANLRGRIQLAQKDSAAARKSFERALEIDPSYFAAAASLAALDMAEKKPADAKRRFEGLLVKSPKNGQALLALAELAALQNAGKDEVAGLLNKAVEANPTDVAPRLLLIELHLRTNEPKLAVAAAQSGVSSLPTSMELLDALGRAQQAQGDLKQANSTFLKLVAAQPLSPQPLMRLAATQHANKNAPAAEQSLRKALEVKPDFLDAQRGLILLHLEAKKFREATAIAHAIQNQRPKENVGFVFEGDIQAAQKDWESAAIAYRRGLKIAESPELAVKLHAVSTESGKVAEAEQFVAGWRKSHPDDIKFLSYLGQVAIAKKDYATAEAHYQDVLEKAPENATALNNLAWVSHQLRRDNAIGYAEKANQLAPNQPPLMDTWAMLLSEKGQHAKAIELQNKALSAQPTNNGYRLNLARIYLAAGDKAKARTELEVITKLGDKDPSHAEAMALMKTL
jgi:putative PEP-CTERM system TPR-repeat lipoprotein